MPVKWFLLPSALRFRRSKLSRSSERISSASPEIQESETLSILLKHRWTWFCLNAELVSDLTICTRSSSLIHLYQMVYNGTGFSFSHVFSGCLMPTHIWCPSPEYLVEESSLQACFCSSRVVWCQIIHTGQECHVPPSAAGPPRGCRQKPQALGQLRFCFLFHNRMPVILDQGLP